MVATSLAPDSPVEAAPPPPGPAASASRSARTGGARAHVVDHPGALLAQARHQAGAHEGGLTRPRHADDGQERLLAQALEAGGDLGLAPEEDVGVALAERPQPAVRALR